MTPRPIPAPQSPSVCAEERSFKWIRARDCLSEASASGTPLEASTAGCPQRSGGTQTVGSPFLLLTLLLAKQKKSESPAAATERHQDSSKNQLIEKEEGFDRLRPNGDGDANENDIRDRAFSGSEHKFPAPSARPSGASLRSQRNCDPTPKTRSYAVLACVSGL